MRDKIVTTLSNRRDNFIWSYQDQLLPNDVPPTHDNYQRFFNSQWYDDTYFSLVVETEVIGNSRRPSEKSFKPIAYYHPFLLIGQYRLLKNLRRLGFETYENLFNESYDDILNFDQRLAAVIKNIDNFDPQPYDSITLDKLQYNHDHFFNQALVESKIVSEIIEPLINYAETR